jgi:D-glycero-D-manno-heptose 1,7-bisphosphate phosphatase
MALMTLRDAPGNGSASEAPRRPLKRAAFLDKDGTLVENVPYNVDPAKLKLTPHAVEGLHLLQDQGYRLIVVTNQSGLARRLFDRSALNRVHTALSAMLLNEGIRIDDYFVCPHAPAATKLDPGCLCRKPSPGMLRQAAIAHHIDLNRSWMVGDILNDVEAGHRAGCRSVLMDVGNETEWRISPIRMPDLRVSNLLDAARGILAYEATAANCSDLVD